MVIGDDEVEAEPACGCGFGDGAHAGIDGDDEADSGGVGFFKHGRLQAVALAEAMRDVKADETAGIGGAQHFDGGFEQDDGRGAVDVVVAVEEDGFVVGDGPLNAGDGQVHAEHEGGGVELIGVGVEEDMGFSCGGDAAGEKQLGERLRNMGGAGEGFGFRVRRDEEPALFDGHCLSCRRHSRLDGQSLVLFVLVVVVDDDVLEALDVFKERLVALVPLGGGFMQKDYALVDEAELDVTEHSGVLPEPLGFDELGGFLVGVVHLVGFFDEGVELFAPEHDLTEGHEWRARMFGHLDEVFP